MVGGDGGKTQDYLLRAAELIAAKFYIDFLRHPVL